MRLIKRDATKTGDSGRTTSGRAVFGQVREVGDRLEYIVARYARLVRDLSGEQPMLDLREGVESLNLQLGYLAQRMQELLVMQFEQRGEGDGREEAVEYTRAVAVR